MRAECCAASATAVVLPAATADRTLSIVKPSTVKLSSLLKIQFLLGRSELSLDHLRHLEEPAIRLWSRRHYCGTVDRRLHHISTQCLTMGEDLSPQNLAHLRHGRNRTRIQLIQLRNVPQDGVQVA